VTRLDESEQISRGIVRFEKPVLGAMSLCATSLEDDRVPFMTALGTIAGAGFDYVSLLARAGGSVLRPRGYPPQTFIDVFASDLETLKGSLCRFGLSCTHIHAGGLDVSSDDSAAASAGIIAACAVATRNVGCSVMTFGIGPVLPRDLPEDERYRYLDRAARAFSEIHNVLQDLPIRLGVDIHYRSPIETVAQATYVIESSGQRQVGLCLNTGHLASAAQAGWSLIEDLPEAVAIVAYKDHSPSEEEPYFKSMRLDRGSTPNHEYVSALQQSGLDVYQVVSIEHEAWDDKGSALYASRRYIEDLWYAAATEKSGDFESSTPSATATRIGV
jgi:sugar phosphate isomerase/epimerase